MKTVLPCKPTLQTMARPLFYFALLLGLLPLKLLAQFCPNGVTVVGGDGQLESPSHVVGDAAGNLYVSDRGLHRIMKFPANSTEGVVFAGGNGQGSELNQLNSPRGLALDQQGNLLVAERGNHRVLMFPPNSTSLTSGTVVAGGNGAGNGPTELYDPTAVTLDQEGYLYVYSGGVEGINANRIVRFPPNSTSATSGTTVAGGNGYGSDLNQINSSDGIAVDKNGNIYVTDYYNSRVVKFPPNSTSATLGTIVAGGNGRGSGPNQLYVPFHVVVDGSGNLIVSDNYTNRIQLFPPGSTSLTAGITIASGEQVTDPTGLFLDGNGALYACVGAQDRVLRFSPGSANGFTSQPPSSQTVCAGATVTATVSVSGTVSGYQWYKDDLSLGASQQQATLNLSSVDTDDGGSYYVVVTGCSSLTSTAFALTVNDLPTVSISPSATAVCAGTPFTLTASGATTYQWQGPGGFTSGASSVTASTSGTYSVTGTTNACSGTATASVTIYDAPPTPLLSVSSGVTQPILQNTPYVTLTVTGCEGGTVSWQGPGGASGSGTTIAVPTSTTGNLAYSATCQVGSCVSSPGSLTVAINPPLVSGSFDGFVNGADCSTFRGWAWDRNKINTAISVDILDGAKVIGTLLAGDFRQDLLDAGKGNGKHGFRFTIPESVKDGLAHNLTARVSGSSFILKDSPKALICQGSSTPSNKGPVPPSPTILVTPLAAQVGVPFSGTLVPFTDPENQPLTYGLSGLPAGLSINASSRVISGTPTEAGTFVLAYSASDGALTNSVSFPLTVNPQSTTTVTGSFEGYLDKLDCGGIRGWVWDRNKPNTPLTVEFYRDGTGEVLGSAVANIYRQDLKDAGKGNGAHAYNFTPPGSVTSGTLIKARVLGSTYELKGGAKAYQCAPARLSAETGSELRVTVLGNPVSDQVVVEVRGAQGQPLRLQLTDLNGRLVTERQIETAKAVEQQGISIGQYPAGLFLLQVSSGSQRVTLKVLKP
ncbi:putative Ig domain-containing protein [Larkinella sp. GY13]|uniref:putative Ig domain-containing protein n=1 Tax=Larkinella sp. GY13 TaxID=3453720 RepID=UPI003EF012A9